MIPGRDERGKKAVASVQLFCGAEQIKGRER